MNQILLLTFIYSSTLIYAAELLGADVCNQPTTLKALIQDGQRHIRDLKIAKHDSLQSPLCSFEPWT